MKFTYALLFFSLIALLDYLLMVRLCSTSNLGTLLPAVGSMGCFSWAMLRLMFHEKATPIWWKRGERMLVVTVLIAALIFLSVEGVILVHAFPRRAPEVNYLVVLGAGLRGEALSLTLYRRLTAATDYLQEHPKSKVIVSGGKGPGESTTEAAAMKNFLLQQHIDEERILVEDRATSTWENLRFSHAVIGKDTNDPQPTLAVLSSEFHLFRVRCLAHRLGWKPYLIAARTPWYLLPNTCTREFFAIAKSFWLDR